MSNYNYKCNLKVIKIDKENPLVGLREIFELDSDFTENEMNFREDTIELNYETEADRIIDELSKDENFNKLSLEDKIELICEGDYEKADESFILSSETYCAEYTTELTHIENSNIAILSIAYIT